MGEQGTRAAAEPTGAPEFSPQQIAGAVSKLISATIGDCAVVFSKSPTHKDYSLADIEWMILPAAESGRVYLPKIGDRASCLQELLGSRPPIGISA